MTFQRNWDWTFFTVESPDCSWASRVVASTPSISSPASLSCGFKRKIMHDQNQGYLWIFIGYFTSCWSSSNVCGSNLIFDDDVPFLDTTMIWVGYESQFQPKRYPNTIRKTVSFQRQIDAKISRHQCLLQVTRKVWRCHEMASSNTCCISPKNDVLRQSTAEELLESAALSLSKSWLFSCSNEARLWKKNNFFFFGDWNGLLYHGKSWLFSTKY